MQYLRIRWLHTFENEPEWIVSELDAGRWEVRKVEIFPDGRKGFADHDIEYGETYLGLVPWPSLLEIAADPKFVPEEITVEEFEAVWIGRKN